jgi:hypothetical protein
MVFAFEIGCTLIKCVLCFKFFVFVVFHSLFETEIKFLLVTIRCLLLFPNVYVPLSHVSTISSPYPLAAGLLWVDLSFNELGNAGLETVAKAIGDDSPLLILDMRHNCVTLHPRNDESSGSANANGAVPLSALVAPTADGSIGMKVDLRVFFGFISRFLVVTAIVCECVDAMHFLIPLVHLV